MFRAAEASEVARLVSCGQDQSWPTSAQGGPISQGVGFRLSMLGQVALAQGWGGAVGRPRVRDGLSVASSAILSGSGSWGRTSFIRGHCSRSYAELRGLAPTARPGLGSRKPVSPRTGALGVPRSGCIRPTLAGFGQAWPYADTRVGGWLRQAIELV